ncbi:MAG: DUF2281 domain-containing protein [Nitrospirae bacterium]|nr:DUF2281 domain-containing protein [Nitrospirota bacterium]
MSLPEKIITHIQNLPEALQAEVLDFVEYLESKINKGGKHEGEEPDWSALSLPSAMRDMEDEYSPYSLSDLKERYT